MLADADGKKVMTSEGEVNVQPAPGSGRVSSFALALNGQGVRFPAPGEYSVDFVIDGKLEANLPLYLRHRELPKNK